MVATTLELIRLLRDGLRSLRDAVDDASRRRALISLIASLMIALGLQSLDLDQNDDGVIDRQELAQMMEKKQEEKRQPASTQRGSKQ